MYCLTPPSTFYENDEARRAPPRVVWVTKWSWPSLEKTLNARLCQRCNQQVASPPTNSRGSQPFLCRKLTPMFNQRTVVVHEKCAKSATEYRQYFLPTLSDRDVALCSIEIAATARAIISSRRSDDHPHVLLVHCGGNHSTRSS